MTADLEPNGSTDEQFIVTVVSANVIEADAAVWSMLEQFLGIDPVKAWTLTEVTHGPQVDENGTPTGKLLSTATFKRDPEHPTPDVTVQVAAALPEEGAAES